MDPRPIIAAGLALALTAPCVGCSGGAAYQGRPADGSFLQAAAQAIAQASAMDIPEPPAAAAAATASALEPQLQAIAESSPMNVAITFVDLEAPTQGCAVQGSRPQRSASMIKLLILNEFFHQASQGLVSLGEAYTLRSGDIVGGTGSLQGRGAGAATTFGEMAKLMITTSDNVATNVIIQRLGMGAINARAVELGLTGTSLNRMMMDTDAIARGVENYMSSDDCSRLLQMVYDGTFVDAQASAFALEALEAQTDTAGILQGLPAGTVFAHKTGTLSNAQNDGGIVMGAHPYVLSMFCEAGPGGYFQAGEARALMARCAEAVQSALGA